MFGLRRMATLFLAFLVLLAPLSPTLGPVLAGEDKFFTMGEETETTADFIDKWILNGNSIGSAAGAVLGQYAGAMLFPMGPAGWILGSIIGGMIGGVVGTLVDNQINKAYNYSSFNRPPLEDGGFILEGVGTWEQIFYQTDQWVVSGGGIGSLVGHFGLNLFGHLLPGPLGKFAVSGVGLFLGNVVTGTIGDNLDATMDMAVLGRKLDEELGTGPDSESAGRPAAPQSSGVSRELYEETVGRLGGDAPWSPEARQAYEQYKSSMQQLSGSRLGAR